MYTNTRSGKGKLNQFAEFKLHSEGLALPEDERSTDASGSEPVTSGSEDESTTPKQSPERTFAEPKGLPNDSLMMPAQFTKASDWTWLWAALRCERRAAPVERRSACATAAKKDPAFSRITRCTSGDVNQIWKAQRPPKRLSPPADLAMRGVNSSGLPVRSTTKLAAVIQQPPVARQREILAKLRQIPPCLEAPPAVLVPVCRPPPGLEHEILAPPGLSLLDPADNKGMKPAPDTPITFEVEVVPYSRKTFRKEMVAIFNEIRQSRTASLNEAVNRVRAQNVPKEEQAAVFSEMMTRAVEEMSGPGRRLCMAFVTGVAAGAPSAFDKSMCIAGIKTFFQDVYDDLKDEVPKLSTRVEREFLPSLRGALDSRELNESLPARLRVAP